MSKEYIVAIIGATGNVGREVLNSLSERNFPVKEVIAAASANSVGKEVSFGDDQTIKVLQMDELDFAKIDIAFFCAGSEVSEKYAKKAASKNCIVIDKSSLYRLEKDVPLIVPEANINALKDFSANAGDASTNGSAGTADASANGSRGGIISNPNCCVIPLAAALKPLDNEAKIKRIIVSTYQSVSGAGKSAMDELYLQTKAKFVFENTTPSVFPTQIAFNLIPQIGEIRDDGSCDEEYKIEQEMQKIMGNHISLSVTCVRVPVFVSHSMSVNVEFENDMNAAEAEEILSEADGIIVYSRENEIQYATPVDVVEHDEVFVSRVRDDKSRKNSINMWICVDNLRKGAALNAVQIAEEIIKTA
ncbi:MAG: aspartate-semialdehyde dehydrogenase [Rickettsiales bacterium]|nr:MAG: aspartate-semialdehyde dehydrogenase [Rickettsiales bacterium]